jgi:hypothetical protein
MISKAKIEANRRNARQSTGPRTPGGNAIACMNALKHGLCARQPLVPGEDAAEFQAFAAGWVEHLQPRDPEESALAQEVILAAWQLRRVPQLRAGLFAREMRGDSQRKDPIHPYAMSQDGYVELARIDRHHLVLERTMRQCLRDLRELQAANEGEIQNEPTGAQPVIPEALPTPLPTQINAPPAPDGRTPASG